MEEEGSFSKVFDNHSFKVRNSFEIKSFILRDVERIAKSFCSALEWFDRTVMGPSDEFSRWTC